MSRLRTYAFEKALFWVACVVLGLAVGAGLVLLENRNAEPVPAATEPTGKDER